MPNKIKLPPLLARMNSPQRWMWALFLLVLAFYIYTLQPSLSWGDGARVQREAITGESFILAELVKVEFAPDPFPFARLGVAAWDHPLYVMLGYLLVHLLSGVSALWLVNLMSAISAAGIIAILFRLCYAHTGSVTASLFACLMLAVSHTFWFHAVTPEVYSLLGVLLLACVYLYDQYERTGRMAVLLGSGVTLGLAASTHLLAFLALPAAGLYFMISGYVKSIRAVKLKPVGFYGSAFVVGFLPYLIQLIRMLRTFRPVELMGPVVGSTFLSALQTMSPQVLLVSLITFVVYLLFQFSPVGLALGIYGLARGSRDFRPLWRKAVALFVVYALFGIFYRVSDQFAFFLSAYFFWATLIAVGIARWAQAMTNHQKTWLAGGLAVSVAVMPIIYGILPGLARSAGLSDETLGIPQIGVGIRDGLAFYINPNKRGDDDAYRFGKETLESLPPNAVIVAQWYTDTDEYLILRYFATVEGLRPDVVILGWPQEPLIDFDSSLALAEIEKRLANGEPVYMASLSEEYYEASQLIKRYCIVPEGNLYRIYPVPPAALQSQGIRCETDVQS